MMKVSGFRGNLSTELSPRHTSFSNSSQWRRRYSKFATASPSTASRNRRLSVQCAVRFRPCIDIHKGKVKQIVGSTLRDSNTEGSGLVTNFESDMSAAQFANLYKEASLTGGHVIMLGADPLSQAAAIEALHAYPGGLQVGGGINAENCLSYIEEGASHVIVTSYVFNNGQMDLERLKDLVRVVGKERLVLDLSCRKKVSFHRNMLLGIDEELVQLLGEHSPIPVTYAGGVTVMEDLERIKTAGKGRVDVTVGSALDIFGGDLPYGDVVAWHSQQEASVV
ncbi:1-(5-phosphoribosyl)-5-[(5-phosphoribosylamino)methylideneamino] imidazole-4-carboxamide isomerase, chloroplastic [Linum perenne]